jgi:hypothetical protein
MTSSSVRAPELCYSPAVMRKFVFLVLAFVVAFQASWTLAAPYCQHERDAATTHFGHHEHDHGSGLDSLVGAESSNSMDGLLAGVDADCLACHMAAPAVMLEAPSIGSLPPLREHFVLALPAAPPPPVSLIERPNWPALA